MTDNQGRDHLILRLRCSKCTSLLNLSYRATEGAVHPHAQEGRILREHEEEVVPGAYKVEQMAAYVEPCRHCFSAPLDAVKRFEKAAADIVALKGEPQ